MRGPRRFLGVLGLSVACLVSTPVQADEGEGDPIDDKVYVAVGAGFEQLPQTDGESWSRTRTVLVVQVDPRPGWGFYASGNLLVPLGGWGGPEEAQLHRAMLTYRSDRLSLMAGRFVRISPRGLSRVDGATVDLVLGERLGGGVWAGRVGHPEGMDEAGDLGAGLEFWYQPGALAITGGYDFRRTPVDLHNRLHLTGAWRSMGGLSVHGIAEYGFDITPGAAEEEEETAVVADEETPTGPPAFLSDLRVSLEARGTLGDHAWRAGAHWLGLSPDRVPWSSYSVLESIAPHGYGVVDLGAEVHTGGIVLFAKGGPTFTPTTGLGLRVGAKAQVTATVKGVGLHLRGTAAGGSWYAGGGAQAARPFGPVDVLAEAGLYRFRGIDAQSSWVGEGRLQGLVALPLTPSRGKAHLAIRLAAGSDRLLAPWGRAGVAVTGTFGQAGRGGS